jgi:protein gp37
MRRAAVGADSKIAWTHHTMNPWEGCVKVSPGCANCYAEDRDKRYHDAENWGPGSKRFLHIDSYWRQPYRWARDAVAAGERRRVFVMSLGDICEDRRDLDAHRERLWNVIRETAHALDWLLLTKRIENARRLVPEDVLRMCWVGTTAEDQQRADERIPRLLATPAAVRFLSVEPMLGPVEIPREEQSMGRSYSPIDWVICGGESGPKARPFDLAWARALRDQCEESGAAFFMKQLGARPIATCEAESLRLGEAGAVRILPNSTLTVELSGSFRDRAGADPAEWPEDLRVREFPTKGPSK